MLIERLDPLTGRVNIKEIDVTHEELDAWENGAMIQDAMPNLSANDREFIKTGIVWEDSF